MRTITGVLIASIVLTQLGCASGQPGPFSAFGGPEEAPQQKPAPVRQPEPIQAQAPQLAALTPAAPLAPSTVPAGPFAGMAAEALRAEWGAPRLTRTDGDGQLWQYQGKGCTVLAYLYPSGQGGLEARYVEARPGGAEIGAIKACLARAGSAAPREGAKQGPKLHLKPG